jgi:hypothetical protein
MKHFIKPSVKLGLLGGVVYIAIGVMEKDQNITVASVSSGPSVVIDTSSNIVPIETPKIQTVKAEVETSEPTSILATNTIVDSVQPVVSVIEEVVDYDFPEVKTIVPTVEKTIAAAAPKINKTFNKYYRTYYPVAHRNTYIPMAPMAPIPPIPPMMPFF